MISKEEIEKILDANVDIITYKADKDYRCLTGTEKILSENNKKAKEYIQQLETKYQKVIEKLEVLKKEYKEELGNNSTKAFILKCQIEILEEIMKGEE